jgi:hypothetical protein
MWKKYCRSGQAQMTIWRMRIACWITKATNTLSEYVILIAFSTATIVERTRLNVPLYVRCLIFISLFNSLLLNSLHSWLLYNTNQWNARFSKLILISDVSYMFRNSWFHPQEDRFYIQYGMLCMHQCEQSGGEESLVNIRTHHPTHQT